MDEDSEETRDRRMSKLRLGDYADLLRYAIDAYQGDAMLEPPSDYERIDSQMVWIFRYCYRHRTRQFLWYQDLSDSGLLHELARVIVLIPFGYSFVHSMDWRLIHGIIRKLLLETSLDFWEANDPGYDACDHHKWRVLYTNFESQYPPGVLPEAMAEKTRFLELWNKHLEYKDEEGWAYRRRMDPFYDAKMDEYVENEDPDYWERRDLVQKWTDRYRERNFTADDWEEFNPDEDDLSDEVLSSDADHSYSSDDSELSTDY